jgi:hypothetical protein
LTVTEPSSAAMAVALDVALPRAADAEGHRSGLGSEGEQASGRWRREWARYVLLQEPPGADLDGVLVEGGRAAGAERAAACVHFALLLDSDPLSYSSTKPSASIR